jgi:hypothetical protein
VSPVRYELGFYIPGDDILHSHCCENLKSYIALTGWTLYWRLNVSPARYVLGFYISDDDILRIHVRENLKSYMSVFTFEWVVSSALVADCFQPFTHTHTTAHARDQLSHCGIRVL